MEFVFNGLTAKSVDRDICHQHLTMSLLTRAAVIQFPPTQQVSANKLPAHQLSRLLTRVITDTDTGTYSYLFYLFILLTSLRLEGRIT